MDKIFLLESLIYLKHVFDYSIICCGYDVPGNYIVISVTAENTAEFNRKAKWAKLQVCE